MFLVFDDVAPSGAEPDRRQVHVRGRRTEISGVDHGRLVERQLSQGTLKTICAGTFTYARRKPPFRLVALRKLTPSILSLESSQRFGAQAAAAETAVIHPQEIHRIEGDPISLGEP